MTKLEKRFLQYASWDCMELGDRDWYSSNQKIPPYMYSLLFALVTQIKNNNQTAGVDDGYELSIETLENGKPAICVLNSDHRFMYRLISD